MALLPENDGMWVRRTISGCRLHVGPASDDFTVDVDSRSRVLRLSSPVSGERIYRLAAGSESSFECVVDGHDFQGLVVRDLMRFVHGLPEFPSQG